MAMDHRIRIEVKSVTQDPAYGTQVVTWVPFATVWAEITETLPSRGEVQANDIRIASRPAQIRIRYLPGLTSDMRVVHIERGNRLLKILTQPAEVGRRQWMDFIAVDFSTQGDAA